MVYAQDGETEDDVPQRSRAGIVKTDDFDTTLYFLDEKEVEYLRQETLREYATDLRRSVLDSLLDIFEFQAEPLVRAEVLSDIEALMLHLLSAGQFAAVAYLLREAEATLDRARDVQQETKERLASLAVRLQGAAHSQHLAQIAHHVHRQADRPGLLLDGPLDAVADPPGRVGRKAETTLGFELGRRVQQAEVAFLDEIRRWRAAKSPARASTAVSCSSCALSSGARRISRR